MTNEARNKLMALMPEMDLDVIDRWLRRLTANGRDPDIYAEAMAAKAKRLEGGCDGFFFAMQRDQKEDDWLSGPLKRIRRQTDRRADEQWPFPRGKSACKQCHGYGWYLVRPNEMLETEESAYDHQLADGFPVVIYRSETGMDKYVFLCLDCNPHGRRLEEFVSRDYPRYPIGGAPFAL